MTFPATHPALQRALATRGYAEPTSVQRAVLEAAADQRDLLVSAQTGSGKTVAFGLAMATAILGSEDRFAPAGQPLALIIAPTRELAMQVQRELAWLYAETGARVVTCVGGMDVRMEARTLAAGTHIVVGTPGRLRDHIERHRLDLSALKAIVLDEADEMLDLGFREDLEFILEKTPEGRQSLLFSATLPRDIEAMAERFQNNALRIETLRRNEQHTDIDYSAVRVAPSDIEHAVVNVLRYNEARAALVFCSTREGVRRLHARLVERGFSAVALSGELTQHERTTALQALRDGRARVLVATDVAARGLDLPDLALVIHADLPINRETLLHRSGRTGRAGRKGLCVLIVPYNRRRKAETLLGAARVKVTWGAAPSADEIRARDAERFLANDMFTEPSNDEDVQLARALQASRSADDIALALVRMHRAQMPAPEDLAEDTGPPARRFDAADRPQRDDGPRPARPPRARHDDGRDMVWFRLNIGRERNADPRWLLPLICRAGGVSKSEIGSIKIFDRDTRFQIVADHADTFEHAARTAKQKDGVITRLGSPHDAPPVVDATSTMAPSADAPRSKPPFKHARHHGRDDARPHGKSADARPLGRHKPSGAPPFDRSAPAKDAQVQDGRPASARPQREPRTTDDRPIRDHERAPLTRVTAAPDKWTRPDRHKGKSKSAPHGFRADEPRPSHGKPSTPKPYSHKNKHKNRKPGAAPKLAD